MDREQEEQLLESIATCRDQIALRELAEDIVIVANGDFSNYHKRSELIEARLRQIGSSKQVWRVAVGTCTYLFVDDSFESLREKLSSLPF